MEAVVSSLSRAAEAQSHSVVRDSSRISASDERSASWQRSLQRLDHALHLQPSAVTSPSSISSRPESNPAPANQQNPDGAALYGDVTLRSCLNDVTLDLDSTRWSAMRAATGGTNLSMLVNDTTLAASSSVLDKTLAADHSTASVIAGTDGSRATADDLCRRFLECRRALSTAGHSVELLRQYQRLCELKLDRLSRQLRKAPVLQSSESQLSDTRSLMVQLSLERNTWRLLCALLTDELIDEENPLSIDASCDEEEVTAADTVARLLRLDSDTRRGQLVVDWLERCAADDLLTGFRDKVEFFSDAATGWENTLHELKRSTAGSNIEQSSQLISSLDPDAPQRQKRHLHDIDAEDERRLLRYLFALLRAGRLDEAQRLCVKIGQPWRAASLDGWKLHDDARLKCRGADTDCVSGDTDADGDSMVGNPLRAMWRRAAWRLADDNRYDQYERAIYGMMCGHVDAVLPVCVSWEDRVWALFRHLVDRRVDDRLTPAQFIVGSLWTRVLDPSENNHHCKPTPTSGRPRRSATAEAVFDEVDALQMRNGGTAGDSAKEDCRRVFNTIQRLAVVGDVAGMAQYLAAIVSKMCSDHTDDEDDGESGEVGAMPSVVSRHLLRAASHLCLLLRRQTDDESVLAHCARVLDSYVVRLTTDGAVDLCVWHITQLPAQLQTRRLAAVFDTVSAQDCIASAGDVSTMDTSTLLNSGDARRRVISLACRAGLDASAACRLLVETRRQRYINRSASPLPTPADLAPSVLVSVAESDDHFLQDLVLSLDWLLFDVGERTEAVRQCNSMCRYLLLTHKVAQAAQLLARLPDDSVSVVRRQWRHCSRSGNIDNYQLPAAPARIVREHLCIKALLLAYESFDDWSEHYHNNRPRAPQLRAGASLTETIAHEHRVRQYEDSMVRWRSEHETLTEKTCQHLYNVLMFPDGGWMCDGDDIDAPVTMDDTSGDDEEQTRAKQMAALRSTFLPQTVSVLQSVLVESGQRQRAIQLVDTVASDRHAIYRHFSKQHLQSYLRRLRDIAVPLLDQGCDALGYALE